MSSHDHWCEKCECHFSPFDFPDGCPGCGGEGDYDLNGERASLPTPSDVKKMMFVVESLAGSLDYDGIKKWLATYPTLDEAYEAAVQLREGMTST